MQRLPELSKDPNQPPSLQEAIAVFHISVYGNTAHISLQDATKWIRELQDSIHGWAVSRCILQLVEDPATYSQLDAGIFTGAAMLLRKKMQDVKLVAGQLQQIVELREVVLTWIALFDERGDSATVTQLAMIVALIAARLTNWNDLVRLAITSLARTQSMTISSVPPDPSLPQQGEPTGPSERFDLDFHAYALEQQQQQAQLQLPAPPSLVAWTGICKCISEFVEECQRHNGSTRDRMSRALRHDGLLILSFLEAAMTFGCMVAPNVALQEVVFKTYSAAVALGIFRCDQLLQTTMLTAPFDALSQDFNLSLAASEAAANLFTQSWRASHNTLFPVLSKRLLENILPLYQQLIQEYLANPEDDSSEDKLQVAGRLVPVFVSFATSYLHLWHDVLPFALPPFAYVVEIMVFLTQHPAHKHAQLVFEFWEQLIERCKHFSFNEEIDLAEIERECQPWFQQLVGIFIRMCTIQEESNELNEYNETLLEDGRVTDVFDTTRSTCRKLVRAFVEEFSPRIFVEACFPYIENAYKTNSWTELEGALQIASELYRRAGSFDRTPVANQPVDPETQALHKMLANTLMALCVDVTQEDIPPCLRTLSVRKAIMRVIGNANEWLTNHPTYMMPAFTTLLSGLQQQEPDVTKRAAYALYRFTEVLDSEYAPMFMPHLLQLVLNAESLAFRDTDDFLDIFKSFGQAVCQVPATECLPAIQQAVEVTLVGLRNCVAQAVASQGAIETSNRKQRAGFIKASELHVANPLLTVQHFLDRIRKILEPFPSMRSWHERQNRLAGHTIDVAAAHPFPSLLQMVWADIVNVMTQFAFDADTLNSAISLLGEFFRNGASGTLCLPLLPDLAQLVVSLYTPATQFHYSILWFAERLLESFADVSSFRGDEGFPASDPLAAAMPQEERDRVRDTLYSMVANVATVTFALLRQSLDGQHETCAGLFALLELLVDRAPLFFLQCDLLTPSLEISTLCISADSNTMCESATHFVVEVFNTQRQDRRAAIPVPGENELEFDSNPSFAEAPLNGLALSAEQQVQLALLQQLVPQFAPPMIRAILFDSIKHSNSEKRINSLVHVLQVFGQIDPNLVSNVATDMLQDTPMSEHARFEQAQAARQEVLQVLSRSPYRGTEMRQALRGLHRQ
ncbi:hypothetical protein CAOG_00971 [Capsaspora owczarzaki ATCC 30864]|uniref:Importin N-terminal domain-containing protein n=1 Tax=Capsaspora owczarzaki (strain ATCC 30864) TaxID=595528 RepID=A0A0D2WI70_CAPO3|nr:hypothetical protein CAOG_00971 [Capsaspora owczarzaki ATCC 30864]KJE89515.1 hypothetical protein CAOG_000971 [Capsaspora owczarzaki ATCC 30864]|eukprot:XP_004365842.2 hypothetical protein CAOG_00971 [Capsaspora owczarzaki ATCC 30864]